MNKALKILLLLLLSGTPIAHPLDDAWLTASIIPLGMSPDGRYLAYLERFSIPGEEEQTAAYSCAFFIIDVPANQYAIRPLYVQHQERQTFSPGMEMFSFREYELRKKLMDQAESHLKDFDIQAGVWPSFYAGSGEDNHQRYFELIWHEGGGHGIELIVRNVLVSADPEKKMLDMRVQVARSSLQKELILQKDTTLPPWRSRCTDYRIDSVYFYKTRNRVYLVCFLKLTLKGRIPYVQYMCVTGDVTEIWDAAIKYQPDFTDGG